MYINIYYTYFILILNCGDNYNGFRKRNTKKILLFI